MKLAHIFSSKIKTYIHFWSNLSNPKTKITTLIDTHYIQKSYSQDGEDVCLAAFYADKQEYKGFYIDIGAYHPTRFSNTQLFYDRGWRGINIDATPGSMQQFNIIRPEDTNLEIGISTKVGTLTYYCFEEAALNSFSKELSEERISKGWKLHSKKRIKTKPINTILEKLIHKNKKIDFINIDIEGFEYEVLTTLDWSKYLPEFILLEELDQVDKDIMDFSLSETYSFLKKKGYGIIAKIRRTLIFKYISDPSSKI